MPACHVLRCTDGTRPWCLRGFPGGSPRRALRHANSTRTELCRSLRTWHVHRKRSFTFRSTFTLSSMSPVWPRCDGASPFDHAAAGLGRSGCLQPQRPAMLQGWQCAPACRFVSRCGVGHKDKSERVGDAAHDHARRAAKRLSSADGSQTEPCAPLQTLMLSRLQCVQELLHRCCAEKQTQLEILGTALPKRGQCKRHSIRSSPTWHCRDVTGRLGGILVVRVIQ